MLKISNITKSYDNKSKVLNNVNLEIGNGIFGLLGPNGAGKSSLIRTIATLQTPDEGAISFNGVDIVKSPECMRQQLGYLPQEYGVYPGVSANDLMHYLAALKGLINKRQRQQQIDYLLDQVNLLAQKHKAVSQFSGGMKQRFGIAQTLLGEPSILIVDEPTAGLDPKERNRFHNLLADVSANKIVILSTHIVEDVNNLCQDMAILSAGKVLKQGNPSHLKKELAEQIWRGNLNQDALAEFQQEHTVLSQRMVAGDTVLHVLSQQQPDNQFSLVEADLEDTYFAALISSITQESIDV